MQSLRTVTDISSALEIGYSELLPLPPWFAAEFSMVGGQVPERGSKLSELEVKMKNIPLVFTSSSTGFALL
jgi:hypothetical protein